MAKAKTTVFFCKECGYESAKWMGQCPGCREWNTFVEAPAEKKEPRGLGLAASRNLGGPYSQQGKAGESGIRPSLLSEISVEEKDRISTGFPELDRVLGDGIVAGSLVLVGGDPGIGKSTLLLQVCRNLAGNGRRVLYISGEESLKQIKLRANRIGPVTGELRFLCETNLEQIEGVISREKPEIVIIDSIQRQSGTGIDRLADADCKRPWDCSFYRGPCDERRRSGRTEGAGTYGRYGSVF